MTFLHISFSSFSLRLFEIPEPAAIRLLLFFIFAFFSSTAFRRYFGFIIDGHVFRPFIIDILLTLFISSFDCAFQAPLRRWRRATAALKALSRHWSLAHACFHARPPSHSLTSATALPLRDSAYVTRDARCWLRAGDDSAMSSRATCHVQRYASAAASHFQSFRRYCPSASFRPAFAFTPCR